MTWIGVMNDRITLAPLASRKAFSSVSCTRASEKILGAAGRKQTHNSATISKRARGGG